MLYDGIIFLLYCVVRCGYIEIVNKLFRVGVDIDVRVDNGEMVLYIVV